MQRNEGFINLGNSRDTSEFACDSLRHWWQQIGKLYYGFATSILLLCDGGYQYDDWKESIGDNDVEDGGDGVNDDDGQGGSDGYTRTSIAWLKLQKTIIQAEFAVDNDFEFDNVEDTSLLMLQL